MKRILMKFPLETRIIKKVKKVMELIEKRNILEHKPELLKISNLDYNYSENKK